MAQQCESRGRGKRPLHQLCCPRLGTRWRASSQCHPAAWRKPQPDFCFGLYRNPEDEKCRARRHQKTRAQAMDGPLCHRRTGRCGLPGWHDHWNNSRCPPDLRVKSSDESSTAWSIPGTSISAWSPSTCRARPAILNPASAAAWASAIPRRICSGFVHIIPSRARERILGYRRHPVRGWQRLPPVPAPDQKGQPGRGHRLQR